LDLQHSFTVPADLDRTWSAFQDIESVAGCFPGATVTQVDGDDFKGTCKVKLGPIAMVYSGSGTFVEKDRSAGRFVIDATGKDKRGNGTAGAVVTARLTAEGTSTRVDVTTDLAITGKPAQFGRGVIQDVSDKLLQQFVTCLKETVGADDPPADAEPAGTPVASGSAGDVSGPRKAPSTAYAGVSAGGAPGGPGTPPAASPTRPPAPASSPAPPRSSTSDDTLDLGATVLPVLARSYGKQVAAGLALVLLGWLLGRRGR
jgi:carbon monoxide dehydrogenase subunit G